MKSVLKEVKRNPLSAPFVVYRRVAKRRQKPDIAKSIFTGLAAGLAGTIAMTQFQNAWSAASKRLANNSSEQDQSKKGNQENEDATMKAAAKIAQVFGHELSHEQKKRLGPVVHYSFGTIQGAFYSTALELSRVRGGVVPALALGTGLFLVADELAVPALGLSRNATEFPLSSHLYGLASHLVYGMSTEFTRKGVRALTGA